VVICTEILEHLIMSPTHMLSEAHQVLKDNGTIIISTPNALYWNRISSLLRGTNIDAAYSAYGVYARHNRNYTMEELRDLLIGCNFAITNSESRTFKKLICKQSSQIKPAKAKRQVNVFSVLRKLLLSRLAKIEHYKDKTLIIVARKIGVETEYFPSRLYQHREEILLTKGKAFY